MICLCVPLLRYQCMFLSFFLDGYGLVQKKSPKEKWFELWPLRWVNKNTTGPNHHVPSYVYTIITPTIIQWLSFNHSQALFTCSFYFIDFYLHGNTLKQTTIERHGSFPQWYDHWICWKGSSPARVECREISHIILSSWSLYKFPHYKLAHYSYYYEHYDNHY